MSRKITRFESPRPPSQDLLPFVHAAPDVADWLHHYWRKLKLPAAQLTYLAVTSDRGEFAEWTGRRLNPMALGCYCYLPLPARPDGDQAAVLNQIESSTAAASALPAISAPAISLQLALPGFAQPAAAVGVAVLDGQRAASATTTDYRHLIFVEAELLPLSTEITVAHELIHLADRVRNAPRKHRCHGHDSISVDEAAITGRDPELLRELLREETTRREAALRRLRPHRYLYLCPDCGREYRRVKKYTRTVSCGSCDKTFNPLYLLRLHALLDPQGEIAQLL